MAQIRNSQSEILLIQPHELGRIVVQHQFDFIRLDSEREQGSNEDSYSVDAVHMQNLAEVASNDASLGADFLDSTDGFHGIGHGLIQAWYHGLAVGSHVNSEMGELFHLI